MITKSSFTVSKKKSLIYCSFNLKNIAKSNVNKILVDYENG